MQLPGDDRVSLCPQCCSTQGSCVDCSSPGSGQVPWSLFSPPPSLSALFSPISLLFPYFIVSLSLACSSHVVSRTKLDVDVPHQVPLASGPLHCRSTPPLDTSVDFALFPRSGYTFSRVSPENRSVEAHHGCFLHKLPFPQAVIDTSLVSCEHVESTVPPIQKKAP